MERFHVKRGLNRIILLPIVLSVLYAGVLLWQLDRMLGADDWVQHTSQILTLSSEVQRHIQFQESALRGYLLLPTPLFFTQFRHEEIKVDSVFQVMHVLSLDNPLQTRRLDTLMQIYWMWQSSSRHSLSIASALADVIGRNPDNAIQDTALLYRAKVAETLQAEFALLNNEESRLYAVRADKFREGTSFLIVIIAAASIVLGLIVGLNARRQTKRFVDRFTAAIDDMTRNRDLLETTLFSIGDAIVVTGVDEKITLMNLRAEELTGWAQTEARGRAIDSVFHVVSEESGTALESPVAAVLRERRPVQPEGRMTLLSRLGVDYPIEQTAAPVHDSRNEIVGVVIVFRDVTELRENERRADLRERESRALIENAPDVITRYARDLTILYANPAIEQMLGMAPQALIGRRFKDVGIPKDVYAPWEKAVEEVFETGRGVSTEVKYRTVRGLRSYHTRLVPEGEELPEGKGLEIQSVISIARDVTEMKQVEQRLRESEERFRTIVENSPEAFYMFRAVRENNKEGPAKIIDFVFEHMNGRGTEMLTLPPGEVIGRRLTDVMPGDRPKEFITKYAHIIESGVAAQEDYHVETPYVKNARWLHSQYIPVGDMLAVTTSDISSRMQTVLALKHSEERYHRLVEQASEAIFSTDSEGRLTYANPFVRELGGYTEDDITKYRFTDLVVAEHRQRVKRHFFRQFLSKSPYSYIEAPFTARRGGEIWLAVTASLQVQNEEVGGFDCIATDISERRRIESELPDAKSHEVERALTALNGKDRIVTDAS